MEASLSHRLSYGGRLRLAWELTWPLALMDLAVVLAIHGMFEARDETLDSAWAVVAFFIASPWVIRRAFRRVYQGMRIEVERGENRAPLRYQESLKVMWLLAWRSMMLGLGALLLVSLALRVLGVSTRRFTVESPLGNALGLSAVDAVTSLVFTPLLVPAMLRKRYKGFRLALEPVAPAKIPKKPSPAKPSKNARRTRR